MKLLNHEELELMIVKVLETEKGLPKGYELVHLYDPTSVAKLTMYSMAHRIRELEATKQPEFFPCNCNSGRPMVHLSEDHLKVYHREGEVIGKGDLQSWVDENINPTDDHA